MEETSENDKSLDAEFFGEYKTYTNEYETKEHKLTINWDNTLILDVNTDEEYRGKWKHNNENSILINKMFEQNNILINFTKDEDGSITFMIDNKDTPWITLYGTKVLDMGSPQVDLYLQNKEEMEPPPAPKKIKFTKQKIHIEVIMDRSLSMESFENSHVEGLENFVNDQVKNTDKNSTLRLITFNDMIKR